VSALLVGFTAFDRSLCALSGDYLPMRRSD
jgi:hypothetical protein